MNIMDLMLVMILALFVGAFVKWWCDRIWN